MGAALDSASEWEAFKVKYGKTYSEEEEARRFGIFKDTLAFIEAENSKQQSFTLGINRFADLTQKEFTSQYTGLKKPKDLYGDVPSLGNHTWDVDTPLADEIDWVSKGAVSPVKNQGQCGSCWAFSSVGALEGAMFIATGTLNQYSEQDFVDCDNDSSGCNGGSMDAAFTWAKSNDICTESSYPYQAVQGTCQASACTVGIPKGTVLGFKGLSTIARIVPGSEKELMSALMQQPVSVGIMANSDLFQNYQSGVLKGRCAGFSPLGQIDHGVLAVGYGTDGEDDYWRIKNSWGPDWGDRGFVRLARHVGIYGECHVLSSASYPVVKVSDSVVV